MTSFKCPQCNAEVTKTADDPLGCPCCGYCKNSVATTGPAIVPYTPYIPYTPYVVPDSPWTVPGTGDWPQPYKVTWYVSDSTNTFEDATVSTESDISFSLNTN